MSNAVEKELLGRTRRAFSLCPSGLNNIIDIGCAHGALTSILLTKSRNVFGIDPSEKAIALAELRNTNTNVRYVVSKCEQLPFKDGMFDAVIMLDVLEHVEDENRAIAEVHRIMKSNGILVISTPNQGIFDCLDPENSIFLRLWKRYFKNEDFCFHRHYDLNFFYKVFNGKFRVKRVFRTGSLLSPLIYFVVMITDKLKLNLISAALRRIEDWDNSFNIGRIAFNIMLVAERVE